MNAKITKDELIILKSILLGKNAAEIKKLLFINKIEGSYPNLEKTNFFVCEENWEKVSDEVTNLYISLSKQPNLTPLEIRVQKKNAKLGFPIKRERITPMELTAKVKEKGLVKEFGNDKLKKKTQPELRLNSPIRVYRYYDLNNICNILRINSSIIESLCNKAMIPFSHNKKFTFDEWEVISPELDPIRIKLLDKIREEEYNLKKSKNSLIHEYIYKMNKSIKEKYQESMRKDAVQRNSIVSNSFKEISTGMKD